MGDRHFLTETENLNYYCKMIEVVFEDNHNKKELKEHLRLLEEAKEYIKKKYNKPGDVFLGTVHRLDRPASGLVVFARTSKSLTRMNKIFQERSVKKRYIAIVNKAPDQVQATLTHWIIKNEKINKVNVFGRPRGKAKKAVMHYTMTGRIGDNFLLEIDLETGRWHQIRAQLARIGCPIRGDKKYGSTKKNADRSINLHASEISFSHPVKKDLITLTSKPERKNGWENFF